MTTVRPWRQEIELIQNYPKHHTFTVSTTNELAKEVVAVQMLVSGGYSGGGKLNAYFWLRQNAGVWFSPWYSI